MSLIPAIVPKSPVFLVTALIVVFVVGIQAARYGYVDRPSPKVLGMILAGHLAVLALFGWFIWPRITVSPRRVTFAGYSNETFDFSVHNGRSEDVYDVQIPFLIGYGKHWDEKFSAKVIDGGDTYKKFIAPYNYCYGKGKNPHDMKPNEQEVFIVTVSHLPPSGDGRFTITYSGGDSFKTKVGTPDFLSEPYSHSDTEATFGVRGNYRACKMIVNTHGFGG